MKKLIKQLVESLFDDDDILDIDDQGLEVASKMLKGQLAILQKAKGNITQYPDDFEDVQYAEELNDVAQIFLRSLDIDNYYKNETEYVYECEFKDYSENKRMEYDRIYFYSRNPQNHSRQKMLFHLNLKGHHVYYLQYVDPYNNGYSKLNSTGKEDKVRFMDILPNILKECDIDEIRLYTRANQDPKKIKTYIFNGIARDKQQIITKETIAKMPVFTIPTTTTTGYAPIVQVNKTAKIRFSYQLRLDTYETLWEFFQYFKRQGFKKYEWTSLFNVQDKESDYEGISNSRELFDKFMVDNNFEVYSFSQKKDIEYAVNQEAYRYCRKNLGYQENIGMLHYCEWKEKGKDDKGQFVYIRFCCDYNDTDRIHRYVKLLYKFYKSGLCILDKVLDDGLEYLRRQEQWEKEREAKNNQ